MSHPFYLVFVDAFFLLGAMLGQGVSSPCIKVVHRKRSRQENAKRSGMYNFLFCSVKLSAHSAACSR